MYISSPTTSKDNVLRCERILGSHLIEKDSVQAAAMLEDAVRSQSLTLAEHDFELLASQHELARALMNVGDNARAVALLEEVVRIQKSTLPESDSSRLTSQQLLAQALTDVRKRNTR